MAKSIIVTALLSTAFVLLFDGHTVAARQRDEGEYWNDLIGKA